MFFQSFRVGKLAKFVILVIHVSKKFVTDTISLFENQQLNMLCKTKLPSVSQNFQRNLPRSFRKRTRKVSIKWWVTIIIHIRSRSGRRFKSLLGKVMICVSFSCCFVLSKLVYNAFRCAVELKFRTQPCFGWQHNIRVSEMRDRAEGG